MATFRTNTTVPDEENRSRVDLHDIAVPVHNAGATTSCAPAPAAFGSVVGTMDTAPCARAATSMSGPGRVARRGDAPSEQAHSCRVPQLLLSDAHSSQFVARSPQGSSGQQPR